MAICRAPWARPLELQAVLATWLGGRLVGRWLKFGNAMRRGNITTLVTMRATVARLTIGFRGLAGSTASSDGRYRFRTIKPVAYGGCTPRIHVKVKLGRRELLTTQLYVANYPGNARDFLWQRLSDFERDALTTPFVAGADGVKANFAVVVAA